MSLRRRLQRHALLASPDPYAPAPWLEAVGAPFLFSVFGVVLHDWLPPGNQSLLMLTSVILVALRRGFWPAALTSVLAALSLNYFFTAPYWAFDFVTRENFVALVFFLAIAAVLANLGARLRSSYEEARRGARRLALLHDFSRRLTAVAGVEELARVVRETLGEMFDREVAVLLPDAAGRLRLAGDANPAQAAAEHAVAGWALQGADDARQETYAAPDGRWLLVPIAARAAAGAAQGVLAIDVGGAPLEPEERRLLLALRNQADVALGRIRLVLEHERVQLLTETEKLRAALLSSVSHDLRTPLVSILGATTSVLELDAVLGPAERRELLETAIEEAERLNRFVQNLLDMTRLGYRAVEVRRQWCDPRDLVADVQRRLRRQLAERELELGLAAGVELDVDPLLVEQVLVNLLDNAAKYSPAGTPIRVTLAAAGGDAVLTVEDRGPGIPPAERALVFDMFHRARAGDSRVAGTGLGLAICRGLLQAMGGDVAADAAPGGGARLTVRLPGAARIAPPLAEREP